MLYVSLAASGCLADLTTKHWVFSRQDMYYGSEWWLWKGHIGIQKSLNEGALFGMGQGNVWILATFSIIALLAIPIWLFRYGAAGQRWITVALGCITGGILGNLHDRLGFSNLVWDRFDPSRSGETVYAVRDWILWQWDENWVWPNFNIADALLVGGAILLMLISIAHEQSTSSQ